MYYSWRSIFMRALDLQAMDGIHRLVSIYLLCLRRRHPQIAKLGVKGRPRGLPERRPGRVIYVLPAESLVIRSAFSFKIFPS